MRSAEALIQSTFTAPGRPSAATRISALRQTAGRSFVREGAVVTGTLAASSSADIGLPKRLERPMTTTLRPPTAHA
jgi:hypothetical protein